MRDLNDVRSWLARPMTGTAETAAAPYWRLLRRLAPTARVVVVLRPVEEAVDSLMRLGTLGAVHFDRLSLMRRMQQGEAKLRQVAARWPSALRVDFADLNREETCAAVFEHCLPYRHNSAWWQYLAPLNVQCDFAAHLRHFQAFRPQLMKFAETAAGEMRAGMALRSAFPQRKALPAPEDK